MTTTLSSQGQILIPREIRNRLGLLPGALVDCYDQDGRIILAPMAAGSHAKLISEPDYIALDAAENAPAMTPEQVKKILCEA